MSILNRVLVGLGSYLTEQGKYNEVAARDELLFTRELALKQIEFQHQDAASARDHTERLDEIAATGGEQRRTALMEGVIADRRKTAEDNRDLFKAITLKKLDFSSDAKLESLRHKYKLSEGAADDARDLQKSLTLAGKTVDHWETTANGRLMAFDKTGHPMTQVETTGGFVPRNHADDELADLVNGGGVAPQIGSSEERTKPQGIAPTNPAKAKALAAAGNAYAAASQNPDQYRQKYPSMFAPDGTILPKDEVIARVNQHFGG